ncbi:MAG: hypothetical protein MSH53_02045 [Solobacterium sp.]|nr:hypothetical protein [Solobacterium sp.]
MSLELISEQVFDIWFLIGAACASIEQLGSVFLTTTVVPSIATVFCMIFSWIKCGKPDVSMCLNPSLAGLLVCFGVWLLDYKLHIDNPFGAVAVHFINGIRGTIAVGLFATTSAPYSEYSDLFYGSDFKLLGFQLLGVISVLVWASVTIFNLFPFN